MTKMTVTFFYLVFHFPLFLKNPEDLYPCLTSHLLWLNFITIQELKYNLNDDNILHLIRIHSQLTGEHFPNIPATFETISSHSRKGNSSTFMSARYTCHPFLYIYAYLTCGFYGVTSIKVMDSNGYRQAPETTVNMEQTGKA
jgi:hypothetical protein